MVDPITRRKVHGRARELSLITTGNRDLMVWWYGGLSKNHQAQSVPLVEVFFRELDERNTPGKFLRFRIALNHLGLLRIGSIWNDGRCQSENILQEESFVTDFSSGRWHIVSPSQNHQNGYANPINQNDYPLRFSHDKNWLINFTLENGKNLLIPCLEFLTRSYGRSEEVSRVLATYPWDGVANHFFAPFDQPVLPGHWPVKLKKRMRNGDVVFLAHALYDSYTQRFAKSIYAQVEAAFNEDNTYAFIKIAPWFQGPAKIKVNGHWINDGQTFLGLQILGCSDPGGVPIHRDRENTNKTDGTTVDNESSNAWRGAPARILTKLPEIFDLTDDEEPDHGSASIEIEEPDFIVMGSPRLIVDARRSHTKSSGGHPGNNDTPGRFSGGEHHGTGNGVGYAFIYARTVMESNGVLRDMWNALLNMRKCYPDVFLMVEWFTFEDGLQDTVEPSLIGLEPFNNNDKEVTDAIRTWVYSDLAKRTPRGVLVVRIKTPTKTLYLVEIQRVIKITQTQDGALQKKEETFKGMVFTLDQQDNFKRWLHTLLSEVRYKKGILYKLTGICPGIADTYKHNTARDETMPCEAAVRNAMKKVDVIL
jgi:hypothetical protein